MLSFHLHTQIRSALSAKTLLVVFFTITILSASASNLISYRDYANFNTTYIRQKFSENGIPSLLFPVKYPVKVIEILYYSRGADNELMPASGLLFMPDMGSGNQPLSTVVYHHGTRLERENPSDIAQNEFSICIGMATGGRMVLMPDYLGLGSSTDSQYYLHAQTEGFSTVDLLNAVNEFLASDHQPVIKNIYLTGYSQGAHAMMAALGLLESEYKDRYHVVASFPMSGPYSLSAAQFDFIAKPYDDPAVFLLFMDTYHRLYEHHHQFSKLVRTPFDSLAAIYLDGSHTTSELNRLLPDEPVEILTELFYPEFISDTSLFHRFLVDNDVVKIATTSPIGFCYCKDDNIVSSVNSLVAYAWQKEHGHRDVKLINAGNGLDHIDCVQYALLQMMLYFEKYPVDDNQSVTIGSELKGSFLKAAVKVQQLIK